MNCIKKIFLTLALVISAGLAAWAQEAGVVSDTLKVKGIVLDAVTLKPIEIADVSCPGFSSTFSNDDGTFELRVRTFTDVISVTALGYQSKEVVLSERREVTVYLNARTFKTFQEFAVMGDMSKRMAYTTRAIATSNQLSEKVIAGNATPEGLIEGQLAGLDARNRSGVPGIGSDLFLRGYSSLYANNQPLIVVDGMIFDNNSYGSSLIAGYRNNPLASIDINDIENITIIKDAASVYGAKASNGVMFIRTSHAKQQATTIDFHMHGGLNVAPEGYPLLNATDYKLYLNEMLLSKGLTGSQISALPYMVNSTSQTGFYRYNNNTNWQKEVFSNSMSSNFGLKIQGGDDIALYALTVGFLKQGGVVKNADYSRFNIRFNSDINFSKLFTLNSNINFAYHDRNIGATGYGNADDVLYQARIKSPFLYPYIKTDDGIATPNFELADELSVGNPLAILDKAKLRDMNYRFFGSFNFNFKLNQNITFSNLVGLSFDKDRETIFIPGEGSVPDTMAMGVAYRKGLNRVVRHMALNNDFRLRYNQTFNNIHSLATVAGARINLNNNEEDWGADYNAANDQIRTLGKGNFLLRQKGGYLGEWNSLTYYLSGDYDFKRKYFLNVSASLDGSSRFGQEVDAVKLHGSKFGFFPSVAGAWLLSSEPALASIQRLDLLKIRASYGLTGNDDIGNYSAKKYYVPQNLLGYQGILQGNLWNPALKWETNAKLNLGVDVSMFHERLSASVDVYSNKTTDMLDFIPVSVFSGFDGYLYNNGSFTTQGIDLAVNTRIVNKPLQWDLGVVLSSYKTNVLNVSGNSKTTQLFDATILTQVDKPLGVFYGYKTNGVYSTQEHANAAGLNARLANTQLVPFGAGDVIFENVNGDNVIDENDMQVIGDPTPDFMGEFSTRLKYKAFTLDAQLAFSVGGDIFNYARYQMESMSNLHNQTQAALNRWQYEGQITSMPKATFGDPLGNNRFSDRWIEDGSYARLKSVTLNYKLPFRSAFFKSASVYASGLNLLTFTKYKGLDPETSLGNFALAKGIDLGMVPQFQSVLVGVKIGL